MTRPHESPDCRCDGCVDSVRRDVIAELGREETFPNGATLFVYDIMAVAAEVRRRLGLPVPPAWVPTPTFPEVRR
jgi:hypothetical protein